VALVGKQYYGPGDFRPYAGLGLWMVLSPIHRADEQAAVALLVRAPVGVEWNLGADHHVGADLSLNRALWIRRKDPHDLSPPGSRIVPLPGFHYRWKR
jgi:outer membrane protein W